jgi:hypothetical protein
LVGEFGKISNQEITKGISGNVIYNREFPFKERPEMENILNKWKAYFQKVLPQFAKLYNTRLARLLSSGFGRNSTIKKFTY